MDTVKGRREWPTKSVRNIITAAEKKKGKTFSEVKRAEGKIIA